MTNLAAQAKESLRDLNVSVNVLADCLGVTVNTIDRWARTGDIPRVAALVLSGVNQWMEDLYTHDILPGRYGKLKYRAICNDTFRSLFKEQYG